MIPFVPKFWNSFIFKHFQNFKQMKKSILIFCTLLTTISITAFGYISWSDTVTDQKEVKQADLDLYYNVSNRWSTMTKEDLKKVKSLLDIIQEDGTFTREAYRNVTISVLHNDKDVRDIKRFEMGQSEVLNAAQLELLHSVDYSTNLRITALSKKTITKTGVVKDDSLIIYMTIIPEKEAEFAGGYDALVEYLKESSKEKTAIIREDKLQPAKVNFTITKEGTIANVKLNSTSGYPSVDETLVELIINMPVKWDAATNSKGEKVDQELVFFFGVEGC